MMTEVIRELTAVKKTIEITSEHVLVWARRVEVKEHKKLLLEGTRKQ